MSANNSRTMDEWRQQQRQGGTLNSSPQEEMIHSQALQMLPQVTSEPAQRADPTINSVHIVAIHPPAEAMRVVPPTNLLEAEAVHVPVEAVSNPRPRPGGCPKAVGLLLCCLSSLAFGTIALFVVKHYHIHLPGHFPHHIHFPRHIPHQMHWFLRAWRLPIILG